MKNFIAILGVIFLLGLMGSCVYFGPNVYEHFGKRYTDADREIFEKNKSYIHGKIENMERLRLEYEVSTEEAHKKAIRRMILVESTTIDKEDIPYELSMFIESLR